MALNLNGETNMKLAAKTFQHTEGGFRVKVKTCNKKLVTTENIDTKEEVKFNRTKFEWMISKGFFLEVEETEISNQEFINDMEFYSEKQLVEKYGVTQLLAKTKEVFGEERADNLKFWITASEEEKQAALQKIHEERDARADALERQNQKDLEWSGGNYQG